MNRIGRAGEVIEWGRTAIVLLILLFVFYQIGKAFVQADSSFGTYFITLIVAFVAGIAWYLKYGSR
jgi:uncharacterized membrane protein YidH (DUF202 family)